MFDRGSKPNLDGLGIPREFIARVTRTSTVRSVILLLDNRTSAIASARRSVNKLFPQSLVAYRQSCRDPRSWATSSRD